MTRQTRRARLSKWIFNAVSKPAEQLRPRLRSNACGMIDVLEPRRMLAVFTAGSGADDITLWTSGGVPHVTINGTDHSTTDTSIQVNCLGGDDDVHMLDWAPGTVVDLGGGWNQVYYGGSSHVLFGNLPSATIIGTTGVYPPDDDEIYFDDSGGGTTARTYEFTPTSAMNQTFVDIDSIDLETRPSTVAFPNTINLTGSPTSFLTSLGGTATLNIGTSSAPVDIDDINVRITTGLVGDKNYFNQDSNGTNKPFVFQVITAGDPNIQIQDIQKGTFRISHYENYYNDGTPVAMTVFGGSTVDQFDIAGLVHASTLTCYGAGGDDICRTTNGTWSSHNDDIDDVFTGSLFAFFGGTGLDYLDLNDINDATNDGDGVYQLDSYQYLKNGVRYAYFDSSTERIQLIGDNGPNDIYFATNPNSLDTVAGAGGNDTLYAGYFASFSGYGGNTFVSGGDGTDGLYVNDNNSGGISQYNFNNGNSFSWLFGSTTSSFAYDSSLEQFNLTQNTGGTTTNLRQISPTLFLSIDANAGDDTVVVGNGDLDNNGFAHLSIAGGSGNDSVVFDDSLDTAVSDETETYTWNSVGLSKGPGVSIVCNPIENETLKVGSTNNALGTRNTVNLDSNNFNTSITNSGNRLTTINVGGGNMNNILGNINIAMPTGAVKPDILNINDQVNANSGVEYTQLAHDFYRSVGPVITQFIHHTGIDQVNLNAGAGNNAIGIGISEAGTTASYNGGGGNDTFYVGTGNLDADLLGDIIVVGGTGTDEVRFNNIAAANDAIVLNDGSLTDAATYYWSSVETVRIQTGPGGGIIDVPALTTPAIIDGGSGPDNVNVGAGNVDGTLFATLTFNGGGGADALLINDQFDGGNDSYNLSANQFSKYNGIASSPFVYWDGSVDTVTLLANIGDNFISVGSFITARLNIFANAGNDHVYTNGSHDVTVDTGAESGTGTTGDRLTVNADGVSATVQVRTNDRVANVLVNGGGTLQLITGALDVTGSLSSTGVIDMAGGTLIKAAAATGPTLAQFRSSIIAGRNGGAWNGTASGAINSSLAAGSSLSDGVGYGLGSQIAPTVIGSFSIAANDTVLRYTLGGDANLDRKVDLTDFTIMAANFNGTNKSYTQADFNYSGGVDLTDFTMLAATFNQSLSPASAASSPPPQSGSMLDLTDESVPGSAAVLLI